MKFLKMLANRTLIKEAQQYDQILNHPQEISKLTQEVVAVLKQTNHDIHSMPMDKVSLQVSGAVNAHFKEQHVTLMPAQLEALTTAILAELQKNSAAYKLHENSDPAWQFSSVDDNKSRIVLLAKIVAKQLNDSNEDISALTKTNIIQQSRAILDEFFIEKDVSLSTTELDKINKAVTTELTTNAIDYK